MKNLYLIAAMLLCFGSYAQLQNANWYFGDQAGLLFLPDPYNPISISTSMMTDSRESCASVSDTNGNLLFYTDGKTVWDATNTVMPNGTGLLGEESSTQGVIIVPKPNSKNYYIFTQSGASSDEPLVTRGIRFSEVDMTSNDIIPSVKNIPVQDHNGTDIDSDYFNHSEKITSTKHSNGEDFWVVAQIRDKIYAYMVSSSGVTLSPVTSTAPVDLVLPGMLTNRGVGQMKISPDGLKIGIAYSDLGLLWGDEYGQGAFALGSFNPATGKAVFEGELLQPSYGSFYGVEFSPDSKYVYFNAESMLFRGDAVTATNSTVTLLADSQFRTSFQLAPNGKIYISTFNYGLYPQSLAVINDPNNPVDPDVQDEALAVGYGLIQVNLPQWVHQHVKECQSNATFTIPDLNFAPYIHKYYDYIVTKDNYSVQANQDITLQAGKYIVMEPETFIAPGSIFYAHIDDCRKYVNIGREAEMQMASPEGSTVTGLTMYPNPSNDIVNIEVNNSLILRITVTSLDGITIAEREIDKANSYTLDVKDYSKGIYIISVQTTDGKVYTEKLIKQ